MFPININLIGIIHEPGENILKKIKIDDFMAFLKINTDNFMPFSSSSLTRRDFLDKSIGLNNHLKQICF